MTDYLRFDCWICDRLSTMQKVKDENNEEFFICPHCKTVQSFEGKIDTGVDSK